MKKVLVIGSSVCDIVINLMDHLPTTGEDVHAGSQHMSLGGCAYNVSDMLRHFHVPYVLFSPTGTG
ncbi:MAG: carbohydrate kinase, partial [Blautia sp.]|nr:carbohydrate kinase [Blautia sp.]